MRHALDHCDSIQCFSLIHSMGGGTGSGLGTYCLSALADEFPRVNRFVSAVFPSANDDVVTSPYNALLATHQLIEFADAVLPVENEALIGFVTRLCSFFLFVLSMLPSRVAHVLPPTCQTTLCPLYDIARHFCDEGERRGQTRWRRHGGERQPHCRYHFESQLPSPFQSWARRKR